MPACATDVSFCGAATTASTSPASAALTAARQNAIDARPLAALVSPNESVAASGCETAVTATPSALSPHARACRASTAGSHTTIGSHAARTCGSSAAFRLISGPMPAGSPAAMAIFGLPVCLRSMRRLLLGAGCNAGNRGCFHEVRLRAIELAVRDIGSTAAAVCVYPIRRQFDGGGKILDRVAYIVLGKVRSATLEIGSRVLGK